MPLSNVDQRSQQSLRTGSDRKTSTAEGAKSEEQSKEKPRTFGAYLLSLPILAYRWLISPWLGPRCRYLPTCSDYALDALAQHGAIKGGWLAVCRIGRCHPFGGHGFDPVPAKEPLSLTKTPSRCGRSSHGTDAKTGFDSRTSF